MSYTFLRKRRGTSSEHKVVYRLIRGFKNVAVQRLHRLIPSLFVLLLIKLINRDVACARVRIRVRRNKFYIFARIILL